MLTFRPNGIGPLAGLAGVDDLWLDSLFGSHASIIPPFRSFG
jgi:hypothetical protein